MKYCPLDTLNDDTYKNNFCMKEKCEWWIKHDTAYGCAVVKIVPELSEIRKWLSIIARQQLRGECEGNEAV